jgi:hypothetical protein
MSPLRTGNDAGPTVLRRKKEVKSADKTRGDGAAGEPDSASLPPEDPGSAPWLGPYVPLARNEVAGE